MQNIEQKLESTLGKKSDLDSRLKSASSSVLTQKIEFQESSRPHSSVTDMLKGKYVNLAPTAGPSVQKSPSGSDATDDGEGLPNPKQILFTEQLDYTWSHNNCGVGLSNPGNSCFLNATLQCLIHCPPLANYMTSSHHSSICRVNNYERCILCNLQFLTKKSLSFSGGMNASLNAKWFNNNLQFGVTSGPFIDIITEQLNQVIGRHFRIGRQEDAHEFLRLSLEKMQKCALIGYNGIDKYSKETTVINQIFGGYLRSQVICCRCGQKSNTYDPLLDVSLDIKAADTIERAFHQFVSPEKLENDNAYKCENCKQKVTAIKKFTIHKAPNVLTIQLKRFQFGSAGHFFGGGNKVHKPVRYPLHLNIRPFMSHKNGPPIEYTLYSSIQHEGMTCNSGHYVANVRIGNKWVNFNDSHRSVRSVHQCLNEPSAYILFYIRDIVSSPQIGPSLKPQNDQHSHWAKRDEMERKQKLQQTNSRPSYAAVVKNSPASHNQQKPAKPVTTAVVNNSPASHNQQKPAKPVTTAVVNNSPASHNQQKSAKPVTTAAAQQSKPATPTYFNKMFTAQPQQKINSVPSNDVGKSVKSPFVPLSSDRDKVKFSIGEKSKLKEPHKSPDKPKVSVKPELPSSPPKQSSPAKPISRINSNSSIKSEGSVCLKVDHGKSFTIECSPDGGRRIINQNEKHSKKSHKRRKIVPYGSDSEDSSSSWSPAHHGGSSTADSCLKENGHKKSGLVLDGALNATTSVPGNAHLYNTVTMKDKVSHKSSHHERRPKDLNMFSSKHGQISPKRQFSETLSCDTLSTPAKHSGGGIWHTSLESMQSPSVGSDHSSVHSSGSTKEWSVLNSKENVPSGSAERSQSRWTVTPGKKITEKPVSKDTSAERVDQNGASSPFEDVDNRELLIKPEKSKDKNSEEYRLYKKCKKHKKHKKRKHHEREHNYAEMSDDSTGRSHKKKKKKHKHRDEDREEKKYVKQEREDEVEKCREREERKHKKHEREQEERMERHREKEDRQHSRKHNRDLEDGHRQKHREDEKDDRQHKGRHDRDGRDKSNKRRRQDSESSNEFEWVEKPAPVRASISEPVTPSHRWDHHINDGYKRPSNSGTSTPTVSVSWDGLRASKVAQELEKVSSYGYGAPVAGWDGGKSQLDIDKESEYVSRKRKDSDDEYDDEFDRGKVKKVKHKHHNEHHHTDNLFQRKQDQINRSKINWSSLKVGENNPFNTKNQPERPQLKPSPS